MKNRCYIVTMNRQSAKTAKRSPKIAGKTAAKSSALAVKKVSKGEKTARGADKKASKSARSPVGKMAETARALMGAARASKAAAAAAAAVKPAATPDKIVRTVSPPVQPAAPEIVLKSHKYQVGEAVYFTSPTFGRAAASGSYTVVKLLPSESDDYQYRIKSSGEAFERVAKESQLEKI
jgi:hypothetical protein